MHTVSPPRSEINVTPLVDVVLVLLIIFMVTTPLIQQGYSVSLPKADRRVDQPSDGQLVVSVIADGSILLNRQPMSQDSLLRVLQEILRRRTEKTVFLSAQGSANYGRVVQVLDIIRNAGATRIGVAPDQEN